LNYHINFYESYNRRKYYVLLNYEKLHKKALNYVPSRIIIKTNFIISIIKGFLILSNNLVCEGSKFFFNNMQLSLKDFFEKESYLKFYYSKMFL
jgi:hypothetical protein